MVLRTVNLFQVLVYTILAVGVLNSAQAQESYSKEQLIIETTDGKRYEFEVELAVTPAQRSQGLMYRRKLAADAGMLFLYTEENYRYMWMKNTYLSLDMLFITGNGHVVDVAQRTVPLSLETIRSRQPVKAVLELAGGTSARLGIGAGARVLHQFFDSEP